MLNYMAMVDKRMKVSQCSRGDEDLGYVVAATDTNDDHGPCHGRCEDEC